MRLSGLFFLFCLCTLSAVAQESVIQETNPPSLKWYQINTPHFRILYPKGFDEQAQRMANTLDRIHGPESSTMGVSPKKIPVILQNQSSISNAFVTLAPRRTEFYTMPSQNYNFTGTNDWLNLIASHEYRHVVQFQRSLTGFNKFFYYIFGQQATAGFAAAAAPQWFWEGDAVATETAFTRSGRGRIPNFNLLFRTNFQEGRVFNYHKQYLRSYKNSIPNHYVLGYHMVSYLRKKTNAPDIWEKIARRAWSTPFIPFTFSNAIHKETGMHVTTLFREMAADLETQWKASSESQPLTQSVRVNPRITNAYTDYLYPQVLSDGTVIAQKSGIGDIERIVKLNDGGEEKLYVQGMLNATGMMSAAGTRVVWNEYRYDPRWQVRNYSVVKGYDANGNDASVLSTRSRYAGAALSPDGKLVATIETNNEYHTQLVVIDYDTKNVTKIFDNPNNDFISMPRWSPDGLSIVALTTNKQGRSISRYELSTGTRTDLISPTKENIGNPVPTGNYILYNSPYSNIDNIYAIEQSSGKRYQITSSKYGAYNPVISADGKTIYYNEQSRNGMDVVKMNFDPKTWKPIEEVVIAPGYYEHLVTQENRPGLLDSVPDKKYEVQRYHRGAHVFNPHSWGPYFSNTFAQANFGIYSQDVLSTTSINGGYQYDINERTGSFQAGVSYQGFYPILDFQILSGDRVDKTSVFDRKVRFDWHETGTSLGFRVPLVFTRSKYYSQVQFGNSVGLTKISSFRNTVTRDGALIEQGPGRLVHANDTLYYGFPEQRDNGSLVTNSFSISVIHSLKQSTRDFNPRWGQYLYFDHYSTPYGGDFSGRLWLARAIAFFPGLAKHHSLFFRGGYQNAQTSYNLNNYDFRNRLFKPRGYAYPYDQTFTTLSANYELPLWYPDIALGPILNIQRVKANVFYDYGHGAGRNYFYRFDTNATRIYHNAHSVDYNSTGVEVTFDVNVMRLLQQIEIGFRVSHLQQNAYNNGGNVFEVLIGNIPF